VTWPHIVLVGLMGSGKTTIGKLLAKRLGRPFRDSDTGIEERTGRTVRELQEELGDERMHEIEAEELLETLRAEPCVIGAAASTIESDACRAALREPGVVVVWLRGSPVLLASRFDSSRHRPRFGSDVEAFLRDQASLRDPLFESVEPVTIDIDHRAPPEIVAEILRRMPG
jgi:shikimate kinase